MNEKIYILDCLRTPIGRPYKSLKNFSAVQLGAMVVKEVIARAQVAYNDIDEIILGNAVAAGTGQNLARQAAVIAGLPVSIPAYMVNAVCGSGLQAIILAARAIHAQEASVVIAGATESATYSPEMTIQDRKNSEGGKHQWESHIYDGLTCFLTGKLMGELAEQMAQDNKISRKEQDAFALKSHQKACHAQQEKKFAPEILPVQLPSGKVFDYDEKVRKDASLEKLEMLPPVFDEKGTLTAGNSCAPCDGASAFVVASEGTIKKKKLMPKALIKGYTHVALAPQDVFKAGVPSTERCLKESGLSLKDIDLFEISEAFAVQAIYIKNALSIPDEKVNIWGGDIALGHPLGVAGTRILTTLVHSLMDQKKKRGLACVCFGGGGSISLIVEMV